MKSILKLTSLAVLLTFVMFSCKKDETVTPKDPVASFQFEIDAANYLKVNFTNFSSDATAYSWDFGDGNSSTEESPSHTYAAAGDYTVVLTAENSAGKTADFTQAISIVDPNEAYKLLTGDVSKTWKLYREGVSMSLGPDATNPGGWWAGLENDGSRPCAYKQEFTFAFDGTYTFDDMGGFWAEYGVFNNQTCTDNVIQESCMDVTGGTLMNACNDDVSAWLSGSHSFTYEPSTGTLTLTGMGAWIGIPKLGTTAETIVPVAEVSTQISIEQFTGYDVMTVEFIYSGAYWVIRYASYSDASLEPTLVDAPPTCNPLAVFAPTEISHDFASNTGGVNLDTIASGSSIVFGADDPTDPTAAKVGMFTREAGVTYQELQLQAMDAGTAKDVDFTNLTTITMDVYFPSSNDYTSTLTHEVKLGFGETTCPPDWWTDNIEWTSPTIAEDTWTTITFTISTPDYVANPANGASPKDRNDLDMLYINIGGSGHDVGGTFYVRNLLIN